MVSVAQAVPSALTAKSLSLFGKTSQTAPVPASSSTAPGVMVSLGSTPTTPLTYFASGLLVAQVATTTLSLSTSNAEANLANGASLLSPLPSDLTVASEPQGIRNALDLVGQAQGLAATPTLQDRLTTVEADQATVPSGAATTADETQTTEGIALTDTTTSTSTPVIAPVTENPATETDIIIPLAANIQVDPEAQALADFTANPVYAGIASALYINAAIYRSQQVSSAALVSAVDLPPPVTALRAVLSVSAERNQQSTADHHRGGAPFAG